MLRLVLAVGLWCWATAWAGDAPTPEETVTQYLTAVKAGDFNAAYPLISKSMAQNKNREEWASEQQWVVKMAEVKIIAFRVFPGKIEGERAYVPNLLNSQDTFVKRLDVQEHELYTLLREDGRWKVDQQQIVERSDLSKWFPADTGATQ
jgi:hypothetical protein